LVGPRYEKPKAAMPAGFGEDPSGGTAAASPSAAPRSCGNGGRCSGNPELGSLIERALENKTAT